MGPLSSSGRLTILSLVLAMTLLGPAPAACLGVLAMVFSSLSKRSPWQSWLANLSTYACFPLVGGLIYELIGGPATLDSNPATLTPGSIRTSMFDAPISGNRVRGLVG